jgi:hypothetical protein
MNESAMIEIIVTTTNSAESHESAAAMNVMLSATNTLAHAPSFQLSSPVFIYGTTLYTLLYAFDFDPELDHPLTVFVFGKKGVPEVPPADLWY